jgi:hypothetical protein
MKALFPVAALGLALLVLPGCRTQRPVQQAPASASSPGAAEPAPLAGPSPQVLRLVERSTDFYQRQPRPLAPDGYGTRVDYQSRLEFLVETNRLLTQIGQSDSALAALTPEETQQLKALSALTEAARNYLADYTRFSRAFEARRNQPLTTNDVTEITQLINAQGATGLQLFQQLTSYIDAKLLSENPGAARGQILRLRRPYEEKIIPNGTVLSLPGLTEFVAQERAALLRRRLQDATAVRQAGSIHLRVRSSVRPRSGGPPTPLHVENYDSRQDLNVESEPRISFRMSEADRARLSAQNQVNTDIARLVTDLQSGKLEIRESLNTVAQALRGDLRAWKSTVTNLETLRTKTGQLIDVLSRTEAANGLAQSLQAVARTARGTLTQASNDVHRAHELIVSLTRRSDPEADPAEVLFRTADQLFTGLATTVQSLQSSTQSLLQQLAVIRGNLAEFQAAAANVEAARELVAAFTSTGPGALPATADAITELIADTAARYPALLHALKSLSFRGNRLAAADALPPLHEDPALIDASVFNPPAGAVSLLHNVARGDVTLTLEAAVVTRQDGTVRQVAPVHRQDFVVEKFGLINTWSADLIFVKRLGDLDAGEREVQFVPAPSLSWTVHYNPPPEPNPALDAGPNRWWQIIYPGVGLNVSALNFRDNGVQVGIGAHVTFLRDLLIGGVGYNLNESRHGSYVFIGISIFESLSKMGVDLPVGR